LVAAAVFTVAPCAIAQERAGVGVVTTLEGTVTVARVNLPSERPLRFKHNVYVRDRITTGDQSIVRVLLGGKATVTARERSVLTITESAGASTVHLADGRVSVAVSKGLMKPGEVIEIRTPNAVDSRHDEESPEEVGSPARRRAAPRSISNDPARHERAERCTHVLAPASPDPLRCVTRRGAYAPRDR
jgi:hypothetical protein